MLSLRSQIQSYKPYNEREAADQKVILECIDAFDDVLTRKNHICHFTSSCWIVNHDHTKVLMILHNLSQNWRWPGGHNDGEDDFLEVAFKEAQEETSLRNLKLLQKEIFSLEILSVMAHVRRGELVNAHLHLNCSFIFEADENEKFQIKPDENSAIRWMTFDEINSEIDKGRMSPHYKSLIERTSLLPSPTCLLQY